MSVRIVGIFLLFFVSLSGCKRCYNCSNVCYSCKHNNDILCNTDFVSEQSFTALINSMNNSGDSCMQVTPKSKYDVCDNTSSSKIFKKNLENQRYKCISK